MNKNGTLGLLEEVVNWAVTATVGTPIDSKQYRDVRHNADYQIDKNKNTEKEKLKEIERLREEREKLDRKLFIEQERAEFERRKKLEAINTRSRDRELEKLKREIQDLKNVPKPF